MRAGGPRQPRLQMHSHAGCWPLTTFPPTRPPPRRRFVVRVLAADGKVLAACEDLQSSANYAREACARLAAEALAALAL